MAANGIKAYVFESLRPTPELSFALRTLGCISGIVITASHNPPEYNGYKVYWEDGAQITAPKDKDIIGEVKGKRVILFDDMVDTGGSLCGAAQALVELGGATKVYACASHGVLSGPAIERIEKSVIEELIFLDTIPPRPGVNCSKLKYLSVASLFAEAIERIYEEVSVSKLFV